MCGLREQISIQASVALGKAKDRGGTADLESIVQEIFPSSEKASEEFYIQRKPPFPHCGVCFPTAIQW